MKNSKPVVRVFRGNSWLHCSYFYTRFRSAYRNWVDSSYRNDDRGFRAVRVPRTTEEKRGNEKQDAFLGN